METYPIRTLFHSTTIQIGDFRCDDHCQGYGDEEAADRYEVVFPRNGVFVRRDASGIHTADANHIIFFNRGHPYQIEHPAGGGDTSTIFGLDGKILRALLEQAAPRIAAHPDPVFPAARMPVNTHQQLTHYRLLRIISQPEMNDPLRVEEQALTFIASLVESAVDYTPFFHTGTAARDHADIAYQAGLYLSRNFRQTVTVEEVAQAVACSPFHLCRVFKQHTGMTLYQYLLRLRLYESLRVLAADRHLPLTDLALDLGFANHSHFSSAFRRTFGLTPSHYRQGFN